MESKKPLVSIITPTLNRGLFLEKAIKSVINQDYDNIEHIIVDGASTDNTLEILKKYENQYNLRWVSEEDNNQTEAWNKGMKMAKGEIIGWCCSDDYYAEGAIKKIVEAFLTNPEIDLVFGTCQDFNYATGKFGEVFYRDAQKNSKIKQKSFLYSGKKLDQPSLFYRKRIIDKIGLLTVNPKFPKFTFEYEWQYRMLKSGAKVLYINEILAVIGQHPNRGSVKYAAEIIKAGMEFNKHWRKPILKTKISYLRWKYPKIPNFFKTNLPFLFSVAGKIIKKL